ncbi:MAG: peptidoglycan-binding protein [Christensenellales bacterium]
MQIVKNGSKGDLVKLVQLMLNENGYNCGTADGIFGTNTEKAVEKYQRAKGLSVDGIVGNNTYAKLFADSLLKNGNRGELVKQCQTMLNQKGYSPGGADGIFGSNTEQAVKALQSAAGIATDGKVGKNTWTALLDGKAAGVPASAHFKLSEFKCKDGTAVPTKYYGNCQKLMNLLEEIRTACGNRAITVTSGYRTESYNKKVDGAKQSQHLYAAAADIKVSGKSASEVYKLCDRLVGSRGGVGKYSTFTHVDVRGHKARW